MSSPTKKQEVDWSNLPHDLLLHLADLLGLIELMNLRGVCKEWRNASLKVLPKKIEPFRSEPWFLIYDGDGSKCTLLSTFDNKLCTARIPELDGATCLASHQGWLLVFRNGSAFFFCPFSMAKIDLPSLPFTELSGHTAAFSAPPTSQDCKVVVVRRCNQVELELHSLSRGQETWAKQNYHCGAHSLQKIVAALFSEGEFHFSDNLNGLVTFAATETPKWQRFQVVKSTKHDIDTLKYWIFEDQFGSNHFKKLGLDEKGVSISTCGTLYSHSNGKYDAAIQDESIGAEMGAEIRHLKGVWIMPRYNTLSMDQRW